MARRSRTQLHTRNLSKKQQRLCKQNPTYACLYSKLVVLSDEVEQLQSIRAIVEKHNHVAAVNVDNEQLRVLEREMLDLDNDLALLAENLIARPKVC